MWKEYSLVIHPCISFPLTSSLKKDGTRGTWDGFPGLAGEGFWVLVPAVWLKNDPAIIRLFSSTFAHWRATLFSAIWWGMGWFLLTCFSFYPEDKKLLALAKNPSPFTPVCSISSGLGCSDAQNKLVLFCGYSWTVNLSRAQLILLPQQSPTLWQTWISLAGGQGWSLSPLFNIWVSWQLNHLVIALKTPSLHFPNSLAL